MFFLAGWTHATLRLFQMDFLRRVGSGTVSELVGAPGLGTDVQLRTIGLRRAAERSWTVTSPEVQALFQAFADGVNAYIASHPPPIEYESLELTSVAPWTPVDSLVIGKLLSFQLSFDLDIDATVTFLTYDGVGQAAGFNGQALFFFDLFRSAPFDPATSVPDAISGLVAPSTPSLVAPQKRYASSLSEGTLSLAQDYLNQVKDNPWFQNAIKPRERDLGSNMWVIGSALSSSGNALLANDPHLALDTPSTLFQIHLQGGGLDVIGQTVAGSPVLILGQNPNITWGLTVNPMDVTDTYQEQVVPDATSPSGFSTLYLGQPEHVIPIPEVFRFNQLDGVADNLADAAPNTTVGGTFIPPVTLIVPRRNNGPIVNLDPATGEAISVQYTGFSGTRELESLYLINRATNLTEFLDGLQLFDSGGLNLLYADTAGNIGYFASSEIPIREDLHAFTVTGAPPFFIRNGQGGNEWLPVQNPQPGQAIPFEILPFDEMPQILNPPAGWIVNANNDPAGTTLDNDPLNQIRPSGVGLYYLSPGYASIRAGRVTQMVRAQGTGFTADDMKRMQADTTLLDAQVFVPHILQAFTNAQTTINPVLAAIASDPRVAEAVGRFQTWDFTTPTGIPEGYDSSDSNGQLSAPSTAEIDASIAATIYSVWRGRIIANTIDIVLDSISAAAGVTMPKPDSRSSVSALRNLLDLFPVLQGTGGSGLNFFNVPGVADAAERRDILLLLSVSEALDLLAGDAFAPAFGNSTSQADYLWGRLHRIVLDHPLGVDTPLSIPPAGGFFPAPLAGLPGIPTDGGYETVDASAHSVRSASYNAFMFGSGPTRRYVGEISAGGIQGQSSLPGGISGVITSPYYFNLLPMWLTNDTFPLLTTQTDILANAANVQDFVPLP